MGTRGINLFGARRGWRVVNATPWPLYPQERGQVSIVQEAGWASAPFGMGAENLASTGDRAPNHTARSEWLYSVPNPGPQLATITFCGSGSRYIATVLLPCSY